MLTKRKPNYNFLKVFGCSCFPLISKGLRNKFEPTANKCVFIGYSNRHKGYLCMNLENKKIIISRNVRFNEKEFPFLEKGFNSKGLGQKKEIKQDKIEIILPRLDISTYPITNQEQTNRLNQEIQNQNLTNSREIDRISGHIEQHVSNAVQKPQNQNSGVIESIEGRPQDSSQYRSINSNEWQSSGVSSKSSGRLNHLFQEIRVIKRLNQDIRQGIEGYQPI